ncbi:12611_t:CDS:2, partial [Acaulospora colombiana]
MRKDLVHEVRRLSRPLSSSNREVLILSGVQAKLFLTKMDVLPTELIQEILQYFKVDMVSPTIAEEAAWKELYGIPNWWSRKGHSQSDAEDEYSREDLTAHYKAVLPLRLVNRLFNDFLTSFIYQELNLFELNNEIDYEVVTRYGTHIRTLRAGLVLKGGLSNEPRLIQILSLCSNIHSVGLYHLLSADSSSSSSSSEASAMAVVFSSISRRIRSIGHRQAKSKGVPPPSPPTTLVEAIKSSIQSKNLRSIGFYYPGIYNILQSIDGSHQALIYDVATSDQAKVIKRLD